MKCAEIRKPYCLICHFPSTYLELEICFIYVHICSLTKQSKLTIPLLLIKQKQFYILLVVKRTVSILSIVYMSEHLLDSFLFFLSFSRDISRSILKTEKYNMYLFIIFCNYWFLQDKYMIPTVLTCVFPFFCFSLFISLKGHWTGKIGYLFFSLNILGQPRKYGRHKKNCTIDH